MIDLDRLARLPPAPFSAGQTASTDRRSRRPEDGESWFANDDFVDRDAAEPGPRRAAARRRQALRAARRRGPGAIVRIWSATPAGTLRIYIDDDPQPALEAPIAALLRGEVTPFAPPLAHVDARGHNLYFPFPFARRCLVTVDSIVSPDPFTGRPIAKLYYQIGFRRYRADAGAAHAPLSRRRSWRGRRRPSRASRRCCATGRPPRRPRPHARTVAIAAVDRRPRRPSVTRSPRPPGAAR